MKRVIVFVRLTLIIVLGYLLFSRLGYLSSFQENKMPVDLLIGAWEGEREYLDDTGSFKESIHLEFDKSGILTYSSSLSSELKSGIVFRFAFISKDRLALTGRIRNEWQIESRKNSLSIQGGLWNNQVINFRKVPNTGPVIATVLGILIFELLFKFSLHHQKLERQASVTDDTQPAPRFKWIFTLLLPILIVVIGFMVGKLLMAFLSTWQTLLFQGLPWWLVISIESLILTSILGTKLVISSRSLSSQTFLVSKRKSLLGLFLISVSVYGISIGIVRLFFLYFLPVILTSLN